MLHWKVLTALAIAANLLPSCTFQEQAEQRSPLQPASIDALATSSTREFLFEVGGLQDAEETFTLENSQFEQNLQMKAIYQPMTLRFQQIERMIVNHQQAVMGNQTETIARTQDDIYELEHRPIAETVNVSYQGINLVGFDLDTNILDFSQVELDPEIDALDISYQYIRTRYQLPSEPALDTLQVLINNSLILPELYSVSNQEILLSFLPPAESEIQFFYRQNTGLLTSQVLAPSTVPSSIIISFDEVTIPTSSFSYDPAAGRIDFLEIPGDGVSVAISYSYRESEQLNYDLIKRPSAFSEIKVIDQNSEAELKIAELNAFRIRFHAEDFVENRRLVVKYKGQDNIFQELRLSHEPTRGSFTTTFDKSLCLSGSGMLRNGRDILLECELEGRSEIRFSYTFMSNRSRFPIHSVTNPEYGLWEVYINDAKIADWRREGNVIIIPENLAADTKVLIRHIPKLPRKS
ncbi:MAG: hypothetical protein ACOH5I_23890 [Oligoflexus sp.]